MTDTPVLPQYRIGFSHCASIGAITRCDERDCDKVREVIDDLIKQYNNKIDIKFLDWEKEHLSEEEINSFGEKANAIIMLIEGEISERQVNGYKFHHPPEKEIDGKSFAKYFIFVKKHKDWTDDNFKKYENEEIQIKIPGIDRYTTFSDDTYLGDYLRKELKNEFEQINQGGQDNGGWKYPKWFVLVCVLALILAGIATALLLFGDRKSDKTTGSSNPGDTSSVMAPIDRIHSPKQEKENQEDVPGSKSGHTRTYGSLKGKSAEESFSNDNSSINFEKDAFAVLSDNNDQNIVFEIARQLKDAQLGLSFSQGGDPQWRIEIRESIMDTSRTEYAGKVFYDPKVALYASIFNSNTKVELLQADDRARVYDDKEKAINAARDKAKEKIIAQIVVYFKDRQR